MLEYQPTSYLKNVDAGTSFDSAYRGFMKNVVSDYRYAFL